MPKPAVIVVNSQVVRGSVGGRVSVFVLERLGYPVWFVPTVQFSWHAGHGPATRLATAQTAFAGFVDDLAGAPWLGEVGAVLTGYLGAAEQAEAVVRLVAAVKARCPAARYLCDPIVGDSGGLFQPEAVATAIRDRLLPIADMATPNRHELAWLTGQPATDNNGLVAAARALGAGEVVVTSAFAGVGAIGNLAVTAGDVHLAAHPRFDDVPHGTGDLFAALYLAARLDGRAPADAVERATAIVFAALYLAGRLGGRSPADAVEHATAAVFAAINLARDMGVDEMPLAAAQSLFEAPPSGVVTSEIEGRPSDDERSRRR